MRLSTTTRRAILSATIGVLVLTMIGCHDASSSRILGSTVVDGSGVIAEESRPVSGFDGLVLAGIGKVYVDQGGLSSLRVRAEDNLMRYLETEARSGNLVIRTAAGYDLRPTREIEYRIVVPDLRRVEHSGAGSVYGSSISGNRLVLARSGVGTIDISNLDVSVLEANVEGIGSVRLDGAAQRQSVILGGLGAYEASALQSAEADVTITGSGSATVRVSDRLHARIDGSGSVYYIGNPVVTRSGNGSGSVVPL